MNFLNPFTKLRIIFLFLSSFFFYYEAFSSADLIIKGSPVIHGFTSNLTVNSCPNYSLLIDNHGILYLGQEDKISIFNGSAWNFIPSKGKNILCLTDNNRVFFSGNKNLGYLVPDSLNRMSLLSINKELPQSYKNFKMVRNIASTNEAVFFQIDSSLLVFNSGEFKVLHENFPDAGLFKANDQVIYADIKGRLFVYKESIDAKQYNTGINNICSIISSKDFIFIFDKNNYLYKADNDFNILSKTRLSFIKNVNFGFDINNDKLFISDSDHSLFVIDQDGRLIERWDSFPEIPRSKILGIFNEPYHGIWILQERSIYLLEYPFTLNRVFSLAKDSGLINVVKFIDNKLYYITTRGLYYFDINQNSKSHLLLPGYYNQLLPVSGGFCVISSDKIFLMSDKKNKLIYQGDIYDCTYSSDFNILFISSRGGIQALKMDKGIIDTLDFFKTSITPYLILAHENLLWYADFENLYVLNYNETSESVERKIDLPGNKRIIDLYIWDDKLNLVQPDEILSLTEDTIFHEEKTFKNLYDVKVYSPGNDSKANLVLSATDVYRKKVLLFGNKESNTLNSINIPSVLDLINPSFEYPFISQLILSSGSEIYFLDLLSYLSDNHQTKTNITGIYTTNDTIFDGISYILFDQQIVKKLENIPYKERFLKFSLSSSNYFDKNPRYHYRLKKNEKFWSGWIYDPCIYLSDLGIGKYELQVNTINYNGNPGPASILTFRILPPFFMSRLAYLFYSLILAILGFTVYKSLRFRTLGKQRLVVATENESSSWSQPDVIDKITSSTNLETDKGKDHSRWDKYEMVTVLFSDIQGFTKIAESTNPEVLIDELDKFFFHFDSVVEKYNIEKIKTIGDAYMAAGGIPKKNSSNPVEVVLAALEMQFFMKQLKNTKVDIWDLRIGIHTGPVIAGEVGHKKRSYDIWGDTVNTASRMESSGEAGKVNISGVTYSHVKDFFICEYRGKLPVKYKGNIDMYFVKNLRPELSLNLAGIPNRRLYSKLQMLHLLDLEEAIFTKFETELPKNMYFHNIEYIRHQYEYAHLISKAESLDDEETLLILTSTLLMNIGFIYIYKNQENKSAEFARSILPEYNYSEKQINSVSNLILSTKWPSEPQTIAEKILYDIKMEYFGRSDFIKLYKLLFLEQNEYQIEVNIDEYKKQMIQILSKYKFFTQTACRLQEVTTEEQIKKIIDDEWH